MVMTPPRTQTQERESVALTLADLKAQPVWVCFKIEERDGKTTKPPFSPLTGRGAKQNDSTTWATYEQAKAAFERGGYDGIGFQFCPEMLPITGIDLDHCVDPETGQIDTWAREIIESLASYTEYSPSKTGVHILIVGNAKDITLHKILVRKFTEECHPEAKVEIYDEKRYFTLTERLFPDSPSGILPKQKQLQAVYEKIAGRSDPKVNSSSHSERRQSFGPMDLTDSEIIDRAMQAKNGVDFSRLWNGAIGEHEDKSTADLLPCQHLAFWTGKDHGRMDRLFEPAGFDRAKGDRQ